MDVSPSPAIIAAARQGVYSGAVAVMPAHAAAPHAAPHGAGLAALAARDQPMIAVSRLVRGSSKAAMVRVDPCTFIPLH
jgi:hypothetical protein